MPGRWETERLYDLRVLERNIRKGIINRKDIEKHLKTLPDRTDNASHPALDEAASEQSRNSNGHAGEG